MSHYNWDWPVAVDLFAAGMGAACFLIAVLADFAGEKYDRVRYTGALIAPWPAILGVLLLVVDLGNPQRFWEMLLRRGEGLSLEFPYLMFNPGATMSWGTWILTLFVIMSLVHIAMTIVAIPFPWGRIGTKITGVIGAVLALLTTVYTGVLISASSVDLWNTPMLPLVFVSSAIATGIAAIVLVLALLQGIKLLDSESNVVTKMENLNSIIITIQLVVLAVFVGMGLGSFRMKAMIGSEFGAIFWPLVVLLGAVVPIVAGMKKQARSAFVSICVAALVLLGGFVLRYVILISGQFV